MSEKEIKTAVGVCTTISEGTQGWHEFTISVPGWDFPLKIKTKLEKLIVDAREAKNEGVTATWTYSEKDSTDREGNIKLNPKNGKPFRDRYLEKVEVGGEVTVAPTTATPSATGGGNAPDVDWDAKERRDFRSRAWAQTIAAFTHTIKTDEKPEAVFLRLQPFQRKVYEDVCGLFAYPEDGSDTPFSGAGQSPLSEHDQNIEF